MKKVASILLTLLFLMSTSHLSFATHFCGGTAFKHGLVLDVNDFGCGMEDEITHEETDDCDIENNCCGNETLDLTIQDNFQNIDNQDFSSHYFVLTKVATIIFTVTTTKNVVAYTDYTPPLPEKDIPVLFQSFLI